MGLRKKLDQIKVAFTFHESVRHFLGVIGFDRDHDPLHAVDAGAGHVDGDLVKGSFGFIELQDLVDRCLRLFFSLAFGKEGGFF
jgi:hypothetical protein